MRRIGFSLRIDDDKRKVEFWENNSSTPVSSAKVLTYASMAQVCRDAAAFFLDKANEYDHEFQPCGKREFDEQVKRMLDGRFVFHA
jgi:hypothetical protein